MCDMKTAMQELDEVRDKEHLNAVLAKERRKLDDVKRLQKKAEAEAEARVHIVPPKPSLAAFVSAE